MLVSLTFQFQQSKILIHSMYTQNYLYVSRHDAYVTSTGNRGSSV